MKKSIIHIIFSSLIILANSFFNNTSALKTETVKKILYRAKADFNFKVMFADVLWEGMQFKGALFHSVENYCYFLCCQKHEIASALDCEGQDLSIMESEQGQIIQNQRIIDEFVHVMKTVYYRMKTNAQATI